MTLSTKIKTVNSTSTVTFTNISGSFYDMIIMIQSISINQTIVMKDTEGNDITENPLYVNQSCKIVCKDIKIGSISFLDPSVYNIFISYTVKRISSSDPYIDIDYATAFSLPALSSYFSSNMVSDVTVSSTFEISNLLPALLPGLKYRITQIGFSFTASSTASYAWNVYVHIESSGTAFDAYYYSASQSLTSGTLYTLLLGENLAAMSSLPNIQVPLSSGIDFIPSLGQLWISSNEGSNDTQYELVYEVMPI